MKVILCKAYEFDALVNNLHLCVLEKCVFAKRLTLGIRKQKSSAFIDIGALNQHG
jgi:hypothetical protein